MAMYWRESLPLVVDRANALCRTGMFAAAHEHYLLGAELAREAAIDRLEAIQIFMAWYCNERVHGRSPGLVDLPRMRAGDISSDEHEPGYGHGV